MPTHGTWSLVILFLLDKAVSVSPFISDTDEEEEEQNGRSAETVETVTEEEQEHIQTAAAASDVFAVNGNDVSATEFLIKL